MGNFFNQLLAPLHIKPFGGSDYADNGQGDRAQDQQKQANPFYQYLMETGKGLVGGAAPLAQNYATGQVSAADTPGTFNNFAEYSGIAPNGTAATDPYQLLPHQQEQYNQERDNISRQLKQSAGRLTASLARRGLKAGDPQYDAAMQHLMDSHNEALRTHETGFYENARQQHQQASQTLAQMLQQFGQNRFQNENQLLGEGTNMIGQGTQGIERGADLMNNIGQQARQEHAASNDFWGGIIGAGAGAAMGVKNPYAPQPGRTPPIAGNTGSDMYDEAGTGYAPPGSYSPQAWNTGQQWGVPNSAITLNPGQNPSAMSYNPTGFGPFNPALSSNSSMFKPQKPYGAR